MGQLHELIWLPRASLKVWHWQDDDETMVTFLTEAQSHTKLEELVLAEKTDLHRHCSFLEAEHEGEGTVVTGIVVFLTRSDWV